MSTLKNLSLFRKAWYTWKAYRFPWRKRYFVGMDLEGNTFWEFRERLNSSRPRRIVVPPAGHSLASYADIKVPPQWHQWLRSTRTDPPTVQELEADKLRIEVLRQRALLADQRWAAKESLLTAPEREESAHDGSPGSKKVVTPGASIVDDTDPPRPTKDPPRPEIVRSEASLPRNIGAAGECSGEEIGAKKTEKTTDGPWQGARIPEGEFQPGEWKPGTVKKRE